MRQTLLLLLAMLSLLASRALIAAPANQGYYRYPTVHGDVLVFTSQGDLWQVDIHGGNARALTSHPGEETYAALSPDGRWVAFCAAYEGPTDIYVMPIEGGLPTRLTYGGQGVSVAGWTPDGRVLCAAGNYSTLPDLQLMTIDPRTLAHALIPLRQASEGVFDGQGTLYFTRLAFQGSHTRRYKGGTAQNLWKYAPNMPEAVPLTAGYTGTSRWPMWWHGRVYFASDRDGTMNLWSMAPDGGGLKQLTHHKGWDLQTPSLDGGRIVYQLGADIQLYDIATGKDMPIPITLSSDLDQTREKWIKNPMSYLSSVRLSPDGSHIALTSRGHVFTTPVEQGRFVEVTRKPGVRYRDARFDRDGKSLLALSDESSETEWWRLPANGIGSQAQLTSGSKSLPTGGEQSPDGKWIVYGDKNENLWLYSLADRTAKLLATSSYGDYGDFSWSPDSRWLAFTVPTSTFGRIALCSVPDGKITPLTTGRADSYSPAWSPDGKWLYFLSDRTFRSLVDAPWGPRQPEPYFDRQTQIYQLGLVKGLRSPFQPVDELQPTGDAAAPKPAGKAPTVTVDLDGIQQRLRVVPVPAGNYGGLKANASRLYWASFERGQDAASLMTLDIENHDVAAKTLAAGIQGYELSLDGRHLLAHRGEDLYVFDAGSPAPASIDSKRVNLGGWTFSIDPREEWRQMMVESWRLERDYFYDRKMNGVDWPAILHQYLPLVDRVRDRAELSDLQAQMVSELSALHMFVYGGDMREGTDQVYPASLGGELSRDEAHGGYRVTRIFQGDPDYPDSVAPLARPDVAMAVGDVIQAINGVTTLSVPDPAVLLRNQAGKQVLLHIWEAATNRTRDCIVVPISMGQLRNLRYTDWELSRRQKVEMASADSIGYVHLRAMGSGDIAQWARDFYPVFDRQGLIIDVRHNGGGNIDSWILEKLMRRAWFYWQPRVGNPSWNMQWAFRGHVVVICDEWTASDGEAFTEGFRRLGIGKVIGTRTWGGEIWLSSDNTLVDNGIATAAETGVYGPESRWLIEGHGVEPDIVVDDLPHASFLGQDAQLDAAIAYLQREIKDHPIPVPPAPAYPDRSDHAARNR